MADKKKRTVMVAVDNSECALKAFNWYLKNGHRPENHVVVTHCLERPAHTGGYVMTMHGTYTTTETWNEIFEATKKASDELTDKYTKELKKNKVDGEVKVLQGQPGAAISSYVTDHPTAQVIMGSRGLNAVRRTLLGSVSNYVLHHAPCAVTVLKCEDL